MYGVSLLIIYLFIFFNIPLSRFIVQRPSGMADIKYAKKIKISKLTPLFVSQNPYYKNTKELYFIEFLLQVLSYLCTIINIILGIISPIISITGYNVSILTMLNIIFGLSFIFLFVIIQIFYSLVTDIIMPKFNEIPMSKLKEAENRIELYRNELKSSIESQNFKRTVELLNKCNCKLLKKYKNTNLKFYFNKESKKYDYYFNPELFHFSSSILNQLDNILIDFNKSTLDWNLLKASLFKEVL